MRGRALLVGVVVAAVAAACVRLGFWQLDRLAQKRALNTRTRMALEREPVAFGSVPAESLVGRRVVVRGVFDESRQLLLAARTDGGGPGVHVVTPLRRAEGDAVLVDRGWLPSADAATADPREFVEPGEREVIGIGEPAPLATRSRYRRLPVEGAELYSALRVDLDSLGARLPYALAPVVLRQLPGPGVPARPVRSAPKPLDENMHRSYALQWFLFAIILVIGSIALAVSRRSKPTEIV